MKRIPLFPLGLVLLPGMALPLHIFEERYKQMIAECLAEDRPFGILHFDGKTVASVGCTARVVQVLKKYEDGRMDIMTRGENRFVVREWIEKKSYSEAQVTFFEDDSNPPADQKQTDLLVSAQNLLRDLDSDGLLQEPLPADLSDPASVSFHIAALEGFTHNERQRILEMTSATERLRTCVRALSRIIERARLTRAIEKIIGGNGRPPQTILRQLADESDR